MGREEHVWECTQRNPPKTWVCDVVLEDMEEKQARKNIRQQVASTYELIFLAGHKATGNTPLFNKSAFYHPAF